MPTTGHERGGNDIKSWASFSSKNRGIGTNHIVG